MAVALTIALHGGDHCGRREMIVTEPRRGFMVSRGYASLSFLNAAAETIAAFGKPVFVYHLGDFDPSGVNAGEKIEETLRALAPDTEIHFERLAVRCYGASGRSAMRDDNQQAGQPLILASPRAPLEVARQFVVAHCHRDGALTLRRWRNGWWTWRGTHWEQCLADELRKRLYAFTENAYYHSKRDGVVKWMPDKSRGEAEAGRAAKDAFRQARVIIPSMTARPRDGELSAGPRHRVTIPRHRYRITVNRPFRRPSPRSMNQRPLLPLTFRGDFFFGSPQRTSSAPAKAPKHPEISSFSGYQPLGDH